MENNLDEEVTKKNSNNPKDSKRAAKREPTKNSNFFVNTKFHFENNSWTWTNGGQIHENEWLAIEGMQPIHPIIPIKVELGRVPGFDDPFNSSVSVWDGNNYCNLNFDRFCFKYRRG